MVNAKLNLKDPRTGEPIIVTISWGGSTKIGDTYHSVNVYTPEQYDALPVYSKMEWRLK